MRKPFPDEMAELRRFLLLMAMDVLRVVTTKV
jgi:hypothetical protein